MKKTVVISVLTLASVTLLWTGTAHSSANDEAQVLQLMDRWVKAFQARDVDGIMSIYEPGGGLVAYDVVPPLQYAGIDAYRKDYQEFLDQFQGAIDIAYRDLNITAGDTVAFSHGLERVTGTLKNGEKFDVWLRFTECYRKINGHWFAVHDHVSVPVDLQSGKAALNLQP